MGLSHQSHTCGGLLEMTRGGILAALLLGKGPSLAVHGGGNVAMKMNCISLNQTDLNLDIGHLSQLQYS